MTIKIRRQQTLSNLGSLRPASFDGSGSSSGGAKLAYIRVGRSKHDKLREVRRASTVESLMHDSSNFEGDTVLDRQPV